MKFTKKLLIPLGIAVVLAIGGIFMINPFTGEKESQYKREQDRMVKYVASNYEGIEKVEFTEVEHNKMTGTYSFYATINNKIKVDFTLWGIDGDIDMDQLSSRNSGHSLTKLETPKENSDVSNIKILYLED